MAISFLHSRDNYEYFLHIVSQRNRQSMSINPLFWIVGERVGGSGTRMNRHVGWARWRRLLVLSVCGLFAYGIAKSAEQTPNLPKSQPVKVPSEALHWSLKPLTKPAPPTTQNPGWARSPIDQFILAKLDEKGMKPSPPADQRTQLRRVY